jgi:hypothetical protein
MLGKFKSLALPFTTGRVLFSRFYLAAPLLVVLFGCMLGVPTAQAHTATRSSNVSQADSCIGSTDNQLASFDIIAPAYNANDPRQYIPFYPKPVAAHLSLNASQNCAGNYYVAIHKLGDYSPFNGPTTIHVNIYMRDPGFPDQHYGEVTTDIPAPYHSYMYSHMFNKTNPSAMVCADVTQTFSGSSWPVITFTDDSNSDTGKYLCSQFSTSN